MTTQWKILKNKAGQPDGNLVTPLCRGAYVALFEPRGIKGQPDSKKKYSLAMLFPKGTDFEPLKDLIKQVATEKWGPKAEDVLRKQQNSDKRIFKDQGEMNGAGFEEGCIYLQASNEKAVGIVSKKAGPDGTLIEITADEAEKKNICKSGDYFLVAIRPFAWEHSVGGKGVSLSLQFVQLFKEGEALGGSRIKPSDAFEAYDDEDLEAASESVIDAPAKKVAGKDPFA